MYIPKRSRGAAHILSEAPNNAVGAGALLDDSVAAKDEAHGEPDGAAHQRAHLHCLQTCLVRPRGWWVVAGGGDVLLSNVLGGPPWWPLGIWVTGGIVCVCAGC
jgi:hypothetical protein